MAFEGKDTFMSYTKRGDQKFVGNVARSDDALFPQYYAYMNEVGAYVIQQVTTSGTLKIYGYYAKPNASQFSADWTGRAGLSYVEYYLIFNQT